MQILNNSQQTKVKKKTRSGGKSTLKTNDVAKSEVFPAIFTTPEIISISQPQPLKVLKDYRLISSKSGEKIKRINDVNQTLVHEDHH
jgi:hypothetical protein